MKDSWINPSELSLLWKQRGNQKYVLNSFISNGTFIQYMTLQDVRNKCKFLGKIVSSPKEGEAYHWPRLRHENLAPLVEMISINENISIFILPLIGQNLRIVIQDILFDRDSFNRKRGYAEDILWALDYLSDRSLCLMNLTEEIIKICDISDKAVICDFSHAFLIERVNKNCIEIPNLYLAPELKRDDYFDPISAEIWACGVIFLQIFTSYTLPSAFMGDEVQVLQAVNSLNYNIVKEANPRAYIDFSITEDLRSFLNLFLIQNPKRRVTIKSAAVSPFFMSLKGSRYKVYESSQNPKCNIDNEYTSTFDQSEWLHSKFEYWRNWLPSKDIYLKKSASYSHKLKPSSNKTVRPGFFSNCDNVSEYSKNYLSRMEKKPSEDKFDYDREKSVLKHISSKLLFERNSGESVVGNKRYKIPQNMNNGAHMNFRISISSSSLNAEGTNNFDEIQITNEKEYDNNDIRNSDCEIGSSVNETDRAHKRLNSKSVTNFDSNWMKPPANSDENVLHLPVSSMFSPLCNENTKSISHYNSLCEEIKELLKEKQSAIKTKSKLKQTYQPFKYNDTVDCYSPVSIFHNANCKEKINYNDYLVCHENKDSPGDNISTKTVKRQIEYTDQFSKSNDNISICLPEPRYFNTTFNKNVNVIRDYNSTETLKPYVKNTLDQSSKNNDTNNGDFDLPESTYFSTNFEENVKNILDYDYLSDEIRKISKETLSVEIKPQMAESETNTILKNCASNVRTAQNNQNVESQQDFLQEVKLHPQEDDSLIAGDFLTRTDKDTEVDETRSNHVINLQTEEGIHHTLCRRNSYKQAIMNDLPVVTEDETDTATKENNSRMRKAGFKPEISLGYKFFSKNKRETNVDANRTDEGNGTISIPNAENTEYLEEIYLLNDTTKLPHGSEKTRKSRRWLKYLCPGSR